MFGRVGVMALLSLMIAWMRIDASSTGRATTGAMSEAALNVSVSVAGFTLIT
jgi:hypothetical protein